MLKFVEKRKKALLLQAGVDRILQNYDTPQKLESNKNDAIQIAWSAIADKAVELGMQHFSQKPNGVEAYNKAQKVLQSKK